MAQMTVEEAIKKYGISGSIMVASPTGLVRLRRKAFRKHGDWFVRIRGWECKIIRYHEYGDRLIAVFVAEPVKQYCPTV